METQTTTTTAPAPAAKRAPRKTGKTKASPAATAKPNSASAGGKLPLKSICAKLGIEPKAARRLLRKAKLSFHGAKERWVFTGAQAEKVRELLKGSEIERK